MRCRVRKERFPDTASKRLPADLDEPGTVGEWNLAASGRNTASPHRAALWIRQIHAFG
jgi:hypothetical protein